MQQNYYINLELKINEFLFFIDVSLYQMFHFVSSAETIYIFCLFQDLYCVRSDLGNLLKALARLDEAKVCFRIVFTSYKLIWRVTHMFVSIFTSIKLQATESS